jgi:ABC-type lipoprotein export system ATPase subunit
MKAEIVRESEVVSSARVLQLSGIFDIPPAKRSRVAWSVDLPIEQREWNVGLIVGPSGCGKSTVARELFGKQLISGFDWPADRSLVDAFPAEMGIKDITMLLSSVGFSSPPSWVRPFGVLSNGEQFRATIARTLAEHPDFAVVDEWTSVVDRQVAQIGSAAVAKTVRRRGGKFVAVTCHYDVEAWLDPDWVFEPATGQFTWRSLQGRPAIELTIARVPTSAWGLFKHHHYLTASLHQSAKCFCAFIGDRPVAFHSYLPFVGRLRDSRKAMRGHRSVCLPDFQGVGIGNALINHLASMWKGLGYRVFRNTGHPAEIAAAARSKTWICIRAPSRNGYDGNGKMAKQFAASRATDRLTASFEYRGDAMERPAAAKLLGG